MSGPTPNDGWGDFALELDADLPFCGCGSSVRFVSMLRDYLASADEDDNLLGPITSGDLLAELIAHIACSAGLTEHGGSVFGSWLTEKGTRALQMWEQRGVEFWAYKQIT